MMMKTSASKSSVGSLPRKPKTIKRVFRNRLLRVPTQPRRCRLTCPRAPLYRTFSNPVASRSAPTLSTNHAFSAWAPG